MSLSLALVALVVSAFGCGLARGVWVVPASVALTFFALVWFRVSTIFEGRTLFVVQEGHGLTEADLVGVVAVILAMSRLAIAAVCAVRRRL